MADRQALAGLLVVDDKLAGLRLSEGSNAASRGVEGFCRFHETEFSVIEHVAEDVQDTKGASHLADSEII